MALAGCSGTSDYHSTYSHCYDSSFRAHDVSDGENDPFYGI